MQDTGNSLSMHPQRMERAHEDVWSLSGAYAEESPAVRTRPKNGDWIDGRYCIVGRPLGKGDLGVVYRVCDREGNEYALKRLSPILGADFKAKQRLFDDFEELVEFRHPHLTSYYELFEADGTVYLLMELVEGISLQRLLQLEKVLPVDIAALVCQGVLEALEYLHIRKVLHHEVKPENILLGRDGSVTLTDYGMRWVEYSEFSQSRNPLQTPHYMSPEQLRIRREGEALGPESDLYSVGLVLYEMLCGDNPYGLTQEMTLRELIQAKRKKPLTPLPEEFPATLRGMVEQLLEQQPQRRLSDTRQVAQLLVPHSPHPQRASARLGHWVEIHLDPLSEVSLERQKRRRKRQEQLHSAPTQSLKVVGELVAPSEGKELFPMFFLSCLFFLGLLVAGVWLQDVESTGTPKSSPAPLKTVGGQGSATASFATKKTARAGLVPVRKERARRSKRKRARRWKQRKRWKSRRRWKRRRRVKRRRRRRRRR